MNPVIKEIDRLAELRRNEAAELEARSEVLPTRIAEADEKASSAAEAGDMGAFDAAAVERDSLRREQEFVKIRLKKLRTSPAVDPDRVASAWGDYRKSYDERMLKAIAEFEKSKRKMLDAYSAMVAMQEESSSIRKRFGAYVGGDVMSLTARFPAKMIPLRAANATNVGIVSMAGTPLRDPDAVYYIADFVLNTIGANSYDDPRLTKLNSVIGNGLTPD